ncbi:DUF1059 domain-containing protein [Tepidiforma sp.]|uniref:DUF1059 domain-containing protein n=1 Tax=Tepidiforma sp. TaxID=2682230 RepID=UPI002ADD7FE3|nr:DUF1059 domain-containing protein [Tepidiforma sp.]
MKKFSCGDVVPGCKAAWVFDSEEKILAAVAKHAREDHGMTEIPAGLVEQVRQHIRAA